MVGEFNVCNKIQFQKSFVSVLQGFALHKRQLLMIWTIRNWGLQHIQRVIVMFQNILFSGVAEVSESVQSFMGGRGRLQWPKGEGWIEFPQWVTPCDPFFCKSQLVKWWWCHNRQRGRWCVSKHCSKMLFFVFVMLNDCVDIDGDSPSTSNWKL